LRTLADLDAAALRWLEAVAVVLDPGVADEQVRAVVFKPGGARGTGRGDG
jgi:hypothetical protein